MVSETAYSPTRSNRLVGLALGWENTGAKLLDDFEGFHLSMARLLYGERLSQVEFDFIVGIAEGMRDKLSKLYGTDTVVSLDNGPAQGR